MACRALLSLRSRSNLVRKSYFSTSAISSGHAPEGAGIYRADIPPIDYGPKIKLRTFTQTLLFAWMFYHFWYNPEIMLGHPPYTPPNPSLWTDEELGIPPDDYDEVIQ